MAKDNGFGINELKGLSQLRGELSVMELENVVDVQDTMAAILKDTMGAVNYDGKETEFAWYSVSL